MQVYSVSIVFLSAVEVGARWEVGRLEDNI